MKKSLLIIIAFSILFGCKSDDNQNDQADDITIIGNWKLVDWYNDRPIDINNDGVESTDLFSQWNGCKKQSTLILLSDNTGIVMYNGEDNNPKCPPGFETGDFFLTEPWSFDEVEQVLTFKGDDYLDSYEVMELSTETLILKGSGFLTCCDADISYFTDGFLKFSRE